MRANTACLPAAMLLTAFTALIFFTNLSAAYAASGKPSPAEILKAVVKVEATVPPDARTAPSLGTLRSGHGAVIENDGLILTVGYLILEAESITVTQYDGTQIPAAAIAYDHNSGFGLVRTARPVKAAPLVLGDSTALKPEDVAIAASYGGGDTVIPVKIASRRDFTGYWEYLLEDAIFTVPPYRNFGGAALLNQDGQLVGIGSLLVPDAIAAGAYGPGNMFIPINRFKPIRDELVHKGRTSIPNHPWIGLYTEEARGRLFVQRVAKGEPSEKAGLGVGDIVVSVGDSPIQTQLEFYRSLWAYGAPGAHIPITVLTPKSRLRTVEIVSVDRYSWLRQPRGN